MRGIAGGRPLHAVLAAQPGQPGQQQHEVDRAPHGRAHPHVLVLADGPGERHREVHHRAAVPRDAGRDLPFRGGALVAEHHPADPVGDGMAHPRGADRVKWVHGGDQPEPVGGPHHAEPGHGDLALGEHRDQDVERLLRDPVELLQVQQGAGPHRPQQRPVGEAGRHVPRVKHLRRVVLPDQPGRRELGVALGEDDRPARLAGDVPQQGGLAGARRALDHHVPAGLQRDGEHLALPPQPHDGRGPARLARWSGGRAGLRSRHTRSRRGRFCRPAGPGTPG